jgi:hypothetical protein
MEHMLFFVTQKKACADDVVHAGFNDMKAQDHPFWVSLVVGLSGPVNPESGAQCQ